MFLDSDNLVFEYTKFYHLIRVLKPDFQRSLLIGGAGYSFPKAYLASYPDAVMDVELLRRAFLDGGHASPGHAGAAPRGGPGGGNERPAAIHRTDAESLLQREYDGGGALRGADDRQRQRHTSDAVMPKSKRAKMLMFLRDKANGTSATDRTNKLAAMI